FRAWHMPFGSKGPMQEMLHRRASSILSFAEMNSDAYIVEQFTGLKDANGKEIYEGDIVHVVTEDGYERTGKVIFEKGCYWVDNGMDKYPVNRIGFERDTLEVLGNVHVNPNIIDFYDMKQL
ncbi:YopX family protein, partial [Lentilactobacillus sp. IMAU92037]|uniref:YopX family protein n=1 Tax=Lentilactobacillus dabitei TaxID=2831523 RepID=UPI001C2C1A04